MNYDDFKNNMMNKIYRRAAEVIENRAQMLKALFRYEIAIANTELAMRSNKHGYDFKSISDSYAEHVVISPAELDVGSGVVKLKFSISNYAFKNASEKEVAFLKEYVLANALQKLKQTN